MRVGDEAADVAQAARRLGRRLLEVGQRALDLLRPLAAVAEVGGVVLPLRRNLDVGVGEDVLAERRVERETVDAVGEREDEDRARAVDRVPRADQLPRRLQQVLETADPLRRADPAIDAEDRPHGDRDVDVRRAVERVEEDGVGRRLVVGGEADRHRQFLRPDGADDAGAGQRLDHRVVGELVEARDRLALDVPAAGQPEQAAEPRRVDFAGDDLRRQSQPFDEGREGAGGLGKVALGLRDELDQGRRTRVQVHVRSLARPAAVERRAGSIYSAPDAPPLGGARPHSRRKRSDP